jgi:hypothetical protein
VSDFLFRLVARSAGEQAAVRPRIVSAFAERRVEAERLPAGNVLEGAPDVPRAMSPLVTETPHGTASARLHRKGNTDEPVSEAHRETSERFDYRDRAANALGSRAEEVGSEPRVLPMIQQTGVAHAGRVLSVRIERQEGLPAAVAQPALERPEAMALRAIRTGREGEKDIKPTLTMNNVSREVHAAPALRPEISKGSLPLIAPKKKSAKEPEIIQVTIGKIEVRASLVASKPTEKKTSNGAMSLDEYQRLRSRRSAG